MGEQMWGAVKIRIVERPGSSHLRVGTLGSDPDSPLTKAERIYVFNSPLGLQFLDYNPFHTKITWALQYIQWFHRLLTGEQYFTQQCT